MIKKVLLFVPNLLFDTIFTIGYWIWTCPIWGPIFHRCPKCKWRVMVKVPAGSYLGWRGIHIIGSDWIPAYERQCVHCDDLVKVDTKELNHRQFGIPRDRADVDMIEDAKLGRELGITR